MNGRQIHIECNRCGAESGRIAGAPVGVALFVVTPTDTVASCTACVSMSGDEAAALKRTRDRLKQAAA